MQKLAKQEVSVHIYTSTLKIEYQDTELAFYTMEWEDNKHIKEVKIRASSRQAIGLHSLLYGRLALMNGCSF